MSAERLRQILQNVADETRPVPLEEAAMKQSHRMTVRRTAVSAAAAVVLLVAGVVGATSVWSGRGPDNGPTPPADSASPTTLPSTSESDEVPSSESPGTLYYLVEHEGAASELVSWKPGSEPAVIMSLPAGQAYLTSAISPDGKYFSWVSEDNKLMLRDLRTGSEITALKGRTVGSSSCVDPSWTPDATKLFVSVGDSLEDEERGYYDVETDEFTPLDFEFSGCHVRVAKMPGDAQGEQYRLIYEAGGTIQAMDRNGEVVQDLSYVLPGGRKAIDLVSVSEGGPYCVRTVGAGDPDGDVARSIGCDTFVMPGDETFAVWPVADGEMRGFGWTEEGGLLVRERLDGKLQLNVYDAGEYWGEDPGPAVDSFDEHAYFADRGDSQSHLLAFIS